MNEETKSVVGPPMSVGEFAGMIKAVQEGKERQERERLEELNKELVAALERLCPLTHLDSCTGLRWGPMAKDERDQNCSCGAAAARAALKKAGAL